MPFTGYLEIDEIPGESRRADHEDQIEVFDLTWELARPSSTSARAGRARGGAVATAFEFSKFTDVSSPYLAKACADGRRFDEIIFRVHKDSGDAHLDYLTITLTNCSVSAFAFEGAGDTTDSHIKESIAITAQKVNILYVVQADDHSAGEEHEVEFDIVTGA